MRMSFFRDNRPVIAGIMGGRTPQELIANARNAEADGARGITVDLADLQPEFRNRASLQTVIEAVNLPFMFYAYRKNRNDGADDEPRQEVLLAAAEAGAAMIDVMGDLYDPSPLEITRDPRAIDKQKRLIEQIHAKGADVVISSHTQCPMTTEQVLEHLRETGSRGADVVKIVTTADTADELAEAFRTTMVLKRELGKPFIHLCGGTFSRPHRLLGLSLGVSIAFAVHGYDPRYGFGQPTIRDMKAVLDHMHWDINDLPGAGLR